MFYKILFDLPESLLMTLRLYHLGTHHERWGVIFATTLSVILSDIFMTKIEKDVITPTGKPLITFSPDDEQSNQLSRYSRILTIITKISNSPAKSILLSQSRKVP